MDRRTFLTWFSLTWLVANLLKFISKAEAKSLQSVTFYVAANGKDTWSGKQSKPNKSKRDGPFATLARARDAVRELKQQQGGTLKQPIRILIRGGTYFLSEPLIFTPEDSGTENCPITYQAYPKEHPVISGGKPITDWKKQGNFWVANLPEVKAGEWYFRLLRVNNNWPIRARYPKFEPNNPLKGGWLFAPTSDAPELSYKTNNRILAMTPQEFPNWNNWDGVEVHIFPAEGWNNDILPITGVDKQSHRIFVKSLKNIKPGNRFFIDNIREALTSPGEWYLDRKTGELLYWPTELNFPQNAEIVAPTMDRLIVFQGDKTANIFVQHIYLQGLNFKDTDYTLAQDSMTSRDAAVWLSMSRYCVIKYCTFTRLGGHGIKLEKSSYDNQIIRNTISQIGQGGVLFWGANINDQPARNLVAANNIQDGGLIYKHVSGVYLYGANDNRITHNRISRMPRYGIGLLSWPGHDFNQVLYHSFRNLIEFNEIHDVCLETSDAGAIMIYTGYLKALSDNIIRYNFIQNVVGMNSNQKKEILSPSYTWGLYLDAHSSGTKVYGNIVINTVLGGIIVNGGKNNLIQNNIFVNGIKNQLFANEWDKDYAQNNVFLRNIITFENATATLWENNKIMKTKTLEKSDYNLYWNSNNRNLIKTNSKITPAGSFSQWQARGFDRNSLVADPLFVDAETGDFQLKPNSPAFKLGFKPIPIERIGPKGFK